MSDEMAVSDNVAGDEDKLNASDAPDSVTEDADSIPDAQSEEASPQVTEEATNQQEDPPESENTEDTNDDTPEESIDDQAETNDDDDDEAKDNLDTAKPIDSNTKRIEEKMDVDDSAPEMKQDIDGDEEGTDENEPEDKDDDDDDSKRGIKRKMSEAFSDSGSEEFKGFDTAGVEDKTEMYSRIVERLEAEVMAATKDFIPLRVIMGTPTTPVRASKRPRKDTDGSRPSSALSSRSDETTDSLSSPAQRGRRSTTEMSSPLLRVPLERGWRRELVYRAALDAHTRRNADIYYYSPKGKKLRSTREVAEHLAGTGLTLENFSFFKEPLGVDDPEKEIIRDAKLMRRVESPPVAPVAPPVVVEGKRTPKPKPPKGASPEPSPKSPPSKIKVKSVGTRLGGAATTPVPATKQQQKKQPPAAAAAPTPDNNNSSAWKKPRAPEPPASPAPPPQPPQPTQPPPLPPPQPHPVLLPLPRTQTPPSPPVPTPVPTRAPPVQTSTDVPAMVSGAGAVGGGVVGGGRGVQQPCSMSCGRGAVPSLACAACLCLYHPACVGLRAPLHANTFLCKNCRKSSSPPLDPPALVHKSGVPPPRRPAPTPTRPQRRVLLRMKAAGSAEGERVWSVASSAPAAAPPHPPHPAHSAHPVHPAPSPAPPPAPPSTGTTCVGGAMWRGAAPQSLAVLNGRRFVVVPRSLVHAHSHTEERRRGRLANGAASPPAPHPAAVTVVAPPAAPAPPALPGLSPRRRGRPRNDDVDHFTAFYKKAQDQNYNVVVQIFQYLGMRELAHCARVCKLWRSLAATPALWRHVRMKNSHVSDWAGLCSALKRHGTKRLDLRKMLLPQNDTVFWEQFAQHIAIVDTLERLEMCRCPAAAVEAVCRSLPGLRSFAALAIRDTRLDPTPLAGLPLLHELRLKSLAGLSLTKDLSDLAALTRLQHLSLTSIKDLGWCACEVVGSLPLLESLELGECTFRAEFGSALARLGRLRRLRLERGPAAPAAPPLLRALARLPHLASLELVNVDVKVGFDDALAECTNIQRLLIIPTYVSQSATTNKQVLGGVLRLKDTLTHLMWGVTIELLRVTELFIDQCEQAGDAKKRDVGECIPVLKPVPGYKLPVEHHHVAGPPQVEILPLPMLQRLLSAQLPNTKLKLLRIPFHATWRQSLADFQ